MERKITTTTVSRRIFVVMLTLCFVLALCPAMTQQAQAAYDLEVFVNGSSTSTTYDGSESNPYLTIAEAITFVESQTYTAAAIYIAAGTYYEKNLEITQSLSLIGTDASTTIIDGSSSGRVLNISSSSAVVTIENLTIQNGKAPDGADGTDDDEGTVSDGRDGGDGGGIYCSGELSLSGCVLTDNAAGDGGRGGQNIMGAAGSGGSGGAIYCCDTLSLTGCVLTDNAAGNGGEGGSSSTSPGTGGDGGDGGGIYSTGNLSITGSNISGNTAGSEGSEGNGDGSGSDGSAGTYSLLYGNSSATVEIENNWWGANSVPSTDESSITPTNYLVLTISAADDTVTSGLTTQITASLTKNNKGETVSDLFSGGTVSFYAVSGSFDHADATFSAGFATNTYTAGTTGTDTITATLDSQTVKVDVSVIEFGISESSLSLILNKYEETTLSPLNTQGTLSWEATGLPSGLSINTDTGVITGTPTQAGTYTVTVTLTEDRFGTTLTATKDITIYVVEGSGNGAYLITPVSDAAYTAGTAGGLIPTMTVNDDVSGFTSFEVSISAVFGHSGNEMIVFVHMRDGMQQSITSLKGDFDSGYSACVALNVQTGDIVNVYIVDDLTGLTSSNPVIL